MFVVSKDGTKLCDIDVEPTDKVPEPADMSFENAAKIIFEAMVKSGLADEKRDWIVPIEMDGFAAKRDANPGNTCLRDYAIGGRVHAAVIDLVAGITGSAATGNAAATGVGSSATTGQASDRNPSDSDEHQQQW